LPRQDDRVQADGLTDAHMLVLGLLRDAHHPQSKAD